MRHNSESGRYRPIESTEPAELAAGITRLPIDLVVIQAGANPGELPTGRAVVPLATMTDGQLLAALVSGR